MHHAEISTGYITLHTIPEGAMVLVNSLDASNPFQGTYVASGYTPLTVPVELADGLLSKPLMIRYTPTGPGQFHSKHLISLRIKGRETSLSQCTIQTRAPAK